MAVKYVYFVKVEDDVLLRAPAGGGRWEVLHKHGWNAYLAPPDIWDRIKKVSEKSAAKVAKRLGSEFDA